MLAYPQSAVMLQVLQSVSRFRSASISQSRCADESGFAWSVLSIVEAALKVGIETIPAAAGLRRMDGAGSGELCDMIAEALDLTAQRSDRFGLVDHSVAKQLEASFQILDIGPKLVIGRRCSLSFLAPDPGGKELGI
ncbi:hypothetical protein AB3G45_10640 [Shinella sp. S4-D37]|uniref:hypothetical protein n=1 Tax=Shinella sp. S4-D37 TaxID=3161999 RepID=UPI00346514F2